MCFPNFDYDGDHFHLITLTRAKFFKISNLKRNRTETDRNLLKYVSCFLSHAIIFLLKVIVNCSKTKIWEL